MDSYQIKKELCDYILEQLYIYKNKEQHLRNSYEYRTTVYEFCKRASDLKELFYADLAKHFTHLIAIQIIQFNIEQEPLDFITLEIDKLTLPEI